MPTDDTSAPADNGDDGLPVIPRYHVIEPIGEGGMGVVYKAEQRTPVRRIVALKVIKLGMDTREVVARFEAERQALALHEPPEHRQGVRRRRHRRRPAVFRHGVRARRADHRVLRPAQLHAPRQRLELFITSATRSSTRTRRAIIHRDIKPSNMLVVAAGRQAASSR